MSPPPAGPARYWIRNETGRSWGPYGLETVGRVDLGPGDVKGRILVSTNGTVFAPIHDHPEVLKAVELALANAPPPRRLVVPRAETTPLPRPPPPPSAPPRVAPALPEIDPGPPLEGTLEAHSTIDLWSRIASLQLTGRLTIDTVAGPHRLSFKKGTPERVEIPHGAEELAKFLARRNAAPAAEIQKALELSGGPDGELLDALYALGLVPPQDVFRYLGEHGLECLERVLAHENGTFRWELGVVPPPASFPLGQRWVLLCEWVRKLSVATVRRRLGTRSARAVYRSGGPRAKLEDLRLSAQETRVAALFDGTRSPEQIALDLPGENDVVFRVALFLGDVAFISFGPELRDEPKAAPVGPASIDDVDAAVEKVSAHEEKREGAPVDGPTIGKVAVKSVAVKRPAPEAPKTVTPEAPRTVTPEAPEPITPEPSPPVAPSPVAKPIEARPVESKPSEPAKPTPTRPVLPRAAPPVMATASHAVPKAADPAPASDGRADLPTSHALLEKWKKSNHFEVLGVTEKAGNTEVKTAYFALARKHHPDTVIDQADVALRTARADITARLNEAYGVLGDETKRTEYLAELKSGGAEQVDVGRILQAEEDFLRATILVKARKYVEALELLEGAIALNPDEGEFYAWRAYARFVSAKEKRLLYDECVAECVKALKMFERCAAAHLFIGHMSKIVGDHVRAEKAYNQVLTIEPKNPEARNELRVAASRKG